MDVLLYFLMCLVVLKLIDKTITSKVIRITFVSLNIVLFTLIVFSSNDPTIARIISSIVDKSDYEFLNNALVNKSDIYIWSYSSYGAIYVFILLELIVTFIKRIVNIFIEFSSKIYLVLLKKRQAFRKTIQNVMNSLNSKLLANDFLNKNHNIISLRC